MLPSRIFRDDIGVQPEPSKALWAAAGLLTKTVSDESGQALRIDLKLSV
jgi:hypothetical protein